MKFQMNKKILIPFVAVLAIFLAGFAAAGNLVSIDSVTFNEVELSDVWDVNVAGFSGDTIPVRVTFEALETSQDVKVRVEIYGGREDVRVTTGRFNVIDGNTYTKLLSLQLPSELKDTTKDLTLYVKVYDANHDTEDVEKEFVVKMQRESYEYDVLSVDYPLVISAGDLVPVSVVVENTGMQELEDGYVIVSIDELSVSKRGYFGDLVPVDDNDEDSVDSVQKTVYLRIPESANAGVYNLDVKVYNKDALTTTSRDLIKVEGSASTMVLAAVKNQDMKAGETATYDMVIVNSGDNVKVYNINAVSGNALQVSVPLVITVGPDSSETVPVTVTAASDAEIGAYTFSVDVNGQQVVFGANITGGRAASSVVALTVVLVIVFVVLLIVLIVLLTRKEKPIEEVETSYY